MPSSGQSSGPAAPFCCPNVYQPNWVTGTYVDRFNVEGAHSCLAFTSKSLSTSFAAANTLCQSSTFSSAAHLVTSLQTSLVSVGGADLLSVSAALVYQSPTGVCAPGYSGQGGLEFALGASTSSPSTTPSAWQWVDGTNSSNLNCGSRGCGLWWPVNQPTYVHDAGPGCRLCCVGRVNMWCQGMSHCQCTYERK